MNLLADGIAAQRIVWLGSHCTCFYQLIEERVRIRFQTTTKVALMDIVDGLGILIVLKSVVWKSSGSGSSNDGHDDGHRCIGHCRRPHPAPQTLRRQERLIAPSVIVGAFPSGGSFFSKAQGFFEIHLSLVTSAATENWNFQAYA